MTDDDRFYEFEPVILEVKNFPSAGYILDIGGGGEGVIGQLKGRDVVAIDIRKDELEETPDGPLKVIMDARDLQFLDCSFQTATAFFSLMYIKTKGDQQKVLEETWRVLTPGGYLHLWEVDLAERPQTDKEFFIVFVRYRIGEVEKGTGYGQRWPNEPRGEEYYIKLAKKAGFRYIHTERNQHLLYLLFQKA